MSWMELMAIVNKEGDFALLCLHGIVLNMSTGNTQKAHYSPPWADTSIIGIAGSSGSGKTSLAVEIVSSLNLPWVVILSMVRN